MFPHLCFLFTYEHLWNLTQNSTERCQAGTFLFKHFPCRLSYLICFLSYWSAANKMLWEPAYLLLQSFIKEGLFRLSDSLLFLSSTLGVFRRLCGSIPLWDSSRVCTQLSFCTGCFLILGGAAYWHLQQTYPVSGKAQVHMGRVQHLLSSMILLSEITKYTNHALLDFPKHDKE